MKTIRNSALCTLNFALAFASTLSGFARTFDVDVSSGRPAASNEAYYHGETIEFRAVRGRHAVTNIEYGCVYYQTNGMGDVWWKTDGLVFHPTNDIGAASYRFFMEGRDDLGRDWHANGLLRLLPSPGFEPNTLEHPVLTLDFSGIEVLNPPWTDPDFSTNNTELVDTIEATAPAMYKYGEGATTNALAACQWWNATISHLMVEDQEVPDAWHYVPTAGPRPLLGGTSFWLTYQVDEGWTLIAETYGNEVTYTLQQDRLCPTLDFGDYILTRTNEVWTAVSNRYPIVYRDELYGATNALAQALVEGSIEVRAASANFADESDYAGVAGMADFANGLYDSTATRSADEIFEALDAAATTDALQDTAISDLADEVAPAVNGYARLYSFVTGSTNANFVVTNYQLTAEAEAARTHFDPSDPDLDFSTVPPSLRLEDSSTGTNRVVVDTRDWTVWYFAQKIGGAMAEAVSTAVNTCRAWCGFTATGLENPVPDTLVVDVPNIWLMAGKTFEKHVAGSNAVWIIRSSGVVMPISDNSQSAGGFMEITDAFGTPYIRFNKTESYFVDPAADGIEYDSATGAWLVTYTTASCPKGGANAVLEGSATYPGKAILKDEDDPDCPATITWTGSANNWVMHAVPKQIGGAVPPKMFFAAVVEVQGQDYIEYLRPMSVPSLMFNGTTYTPAVNGNKLEFIAQ